MIQIVCNKYVLVLRDETESEEFGLEIPSEGRTKPHSGTIHAVGSKVEDENIKASVGKKCLFHKGVGQEIEYEGVLYLVLFAGEPGEIIAIP